MYNSQQFLQLNLCLLILSIFKTNIALPIMTTFVKHYINLAGCDNKKAYIY